MAQWKTICDAPSIIGDVDLVEKTAEAELYAMRSSYHQALSQLNESVHQGDEQWKKAKSGLAMLVEQIQSISDTEVVSIDTMSDEEDAVVRQARADRLHILCLSQKNLSRMLSQEPDMSSKQKALELALSACASLSDLGHIDAGLVLRTAHMAHTVGDDWTCRQLLAQPIVGNGLHSTAMTRLHKEVEKEDVCGAHASRLASCWQTLTPNEKLDMGEAPSPVVVPPPRAGLAALVKRLSQPLHGLSSSTLATMRDGLYSADMPAEPNSAHVSLPPTPIAAAVSPPQTSPCTADACIADDSSIMLGKRPHSTIINESEQSIKPTEPTQGEGRVTRRRGHYRCTGSGLPAPIRLQNEAGFINEREGEMWGMFREVLGNCNPRITKLVSCAGPLLEKLLEERFPE